MKVLVYRHRNMHLRLGVGPSHAEANGGLVLRGQTSWRNVNGLWINTPRWQAWILFRRYPFGR